MARSVRFAASSAGLLLAGSVLGAQSIEPVVSEGELFLGFTITNLRDLVVLDDGSWFAAVSTLPAQGDSLSIVSEVLGTRGVWTPGPVTGLTGAAATLVHDFTQGSYSQAGTLITIASVLHGLIPGESVELEFSTLPPAPPAPAGGVFLVQSVLDERTFTVTHGSSLVCGSVLAPCGVATLVRRIQSSDLHVSGPCRPDFVGVLQLEDDDDPATPPILTPNSLSTALFWGTTPLVREGQVCLAPEVAPGTLYRRIWRSQVDSRQDAYALVRLDDPSLPGTENALVKLDVSDTCPPTLLAEQVLIRTGEVLQDAGGDRFANFQSLEQRGFDANERGDFIYLAATTERDGLPSGPASVVVNNRVVLRTFTQVPRGINDNLIVHFPMASVDLNDLGDYVVQVKLQEGAPPHNPEYGEAILKGHTSDDGPVKFVQSGEPVPDPDFRTNGEILVHVGRVRELTAPLRAFPALVTGGGDVIWYGQWGFEDGAPVITGAGLFVNHEVVAHEGQEFGSDDVLLAIGNDQEDHATELEVSANGRYLLFEGVRGKLSDPNFAALTLFRIDLGEAVPYGTVAQTTGGSGCTYAYPEARLECLPGLPLPGSGALGDFPLLGHELQLLASAGPAGTTDVLFAFTPAAPAGFPCGFFRAGFAHEILLAPAPVLGASSPYIGGTALLSQRIPPAASVLLGQDWYAQAFFRSGARIVGATNGLRLVVGTP